MLLRRSSGIYPTLYILFINLVIRVIQFLTYTEAALQEYYLLLTLSLWEDYLLLLSPHFHLSNTFHLLDLPCLCLPYYPHTILPHIPPIFPQFRFLITTICHSYRLSNASLYVS